LTGREACPTWRGDGEGGAGGFEESFEAGAFGDGDLPAIGADFDDFVTGVGEVEGDVVFAMRGAVAGDAAGDDVGVDIARMGLRFEVLEQALEGLGGGDVVEGVMELEEKPVAKGAGADGEGAAVID
jgi:hypothetical protein